MLNNKRRRPTVKLPQDQPRPNPVVIFKLGALHMDVISVSFHVPSFPWTNKCLQVDCHSVVAGSDVFSLGQWSECPWTVDLLLSGEKLGVGWTWGGWGDECEATDPCCQVVSSLSEWQVFQLFASAANISEVFLGVEESCCKSVCIDLGSFKVGLFGYRCWNRLDCLRSSWLISVEVSDIINIDWFFDHNWICD